MSSSDTDDDCYGNITKKLQNIKNKYQYDDMDTANLLNNSTEIKNTTQSETNVIKCDDSEIILLDDDDTILDQIIALNSIQKQTSRGRRCKTNVPRARGARSNRGRSNRGKQNTSLDKSDDSLDTCPSRNTRSAANTSCITITDSPVRGQSRGRARSRSRARGNRSTSRRSRGPSYPVYSIGNTEEYTDLSDDVQLFTSNVKAQDVIDDIIDENEELSIKVYWQSSDIIKFTIRKYQKLSQIFDFFSKRENVGVEKLLLTYNDRILKPDDTPDSIDYSIAKFIDGGIVNNRVPILESSDKEISGIMLKFQCQNLKKPLEITVQPDERMIQAFTKCAEHLEQPLNKLKFEFDGDCITGAMTAQELELEAGECIDVKIIR
ncbi:uncharacterized protein LOC119836428 [Zerene cesonia]|uniref:uncharacterized protein LOC119836428 n=1 Tax=Zerene cesonia TaxID=33412 RepID=UPI0018E534B0|nr:uncharacterized protein LOC119836428 [Zerene cesonia]